jgi:hypothetical protein
MKGSLMRSPITRDIIPIDAGDKVLIAKLQKDVGLLQENIVILQKQLQESYKRIEELTQLNTIYKEK